MRLPVCEKEIALNVKDFNSELWKGRGLVVVSDVLAWLPGDKNVASFHRSTTVSVFHSSTCVNWLSC